MADDTNTAERDAFKAAHQHLDLVERPDAWGSPVFRASHVEASWRGWQARASLAASEPVAPSEDVQKKIQSNTWDHFGAILPTLKAISRGDWYWGANSRCKYIEIRLDTRDGGCLLFDRERVRISPEQFAHQSHGGVKMEPWPATDLTHPSPPEGMAGWISVDERLPEPDGPVLAHNGKWTGVAAWMSGDYLEPLERWQDEHREFIEMMGPAITHWMPLPAPPLPASEAKEL